VVSATSAPSWGVAAAILVVDDCAKHYRRLSNEVIATSISDLGARGGKDPWQTLRSDMTKNHSDIFQGHGGRTGYYQIGDSAAALQRPDVQLAVSYLADVALDRCQRLIHWIASFGVDLSNRDFGKDKSCLEALERRLAHIARLFSIKQST
jgi:hypothetical protein